MQNTILGQHRAIVSAGRSRLFAPLLQFEKREIHTVFLRFPNFELSQKSRLGLLAKLCGVALEVPRRIRTSSSLPPLGVVLRAANQDINDCRRQSCLCLVPQSGKGGVVGIFLSRHHSTNRTPSATRQEPPDGGCSLAWRLRIAKSALTGCQLPHRGAKKTLRIRPGFHKTAGACRNPSAAAAAAQLCMKRLYAVKDGYTR